MIMVNNQAGTPYEPLDHAPWHGCTPTDLVFPFFLFAVGNAMAFVMPRFEQRGDAYFWKKVLKRTLLIFAIGLFLQWWPFMRWQDGSLAGNGWTWTTTNPDTGEVSLHGIRILGVLQRIALCYFFGALLVYYLKPRLAFLTGLIILLAYWFLCWALGDPAAPFSMTGWFGNSVDRFVLHDPHIYKGESLNGQPYAFDPEGIMSTLPAIVQVVFGYLVGDYILKRSVQQDSVVNEAAGREAILYRTLTGLFVAAMAFLFAGYAWGLSFPVNKKIWTSSYVLVTTGMATAVLATLVYAIEVKGVRGWWTRFFDVFGKNALFVFALSAFLPRTLRLIRIPNGHTDAGQVKYTNPWNFLYDSVYRFVPGDPRIGSLCWALTVIFFMWAVCWWLDKRKIYIKV